MIEWHLATFPIMPLRVFNDRTAVVGFATSFLQGMLLWCSIYYMIIFASIHTDVNLCDTLTLTLPYALSAAYAAGW